MPDKRATVGSQRVRPRRRASREPARFSLLDPPTRCLVVHRVRETRWPLRVAPLLAARFSPASDATSMRQKGTDQFLSRRRHQSARCIPFRSGCAPWLMRVGQLPPTGPQQQVVRPPGMRPVGGIRPTRRTSPNRRWAPPLRPCPTVSSIRAASPQVRGRGVPDLPCSGGERGCAMGRSIP